MERRFVPLKPQPRFGHDDNTPLGLAKPLAQKRRKISIAIACNECRRRKIRCDGGRPTCDNCIGTHGQCEYRLDDAGLSRESKTLVVEMVQILNHIPAKETVQILKGLKEADAISIITTLRGRAESLAIRSAETGATRNDTSESTELELDHPLAYPRLARLDHDLLDTTAYQALVQPSPQPPTTLLQVPEPSQPSTTTEPPHALPIMTPDSQASTSAILTYPSQSRALDPQQQSPKLYDPRLEKLRIARWTHANMNDSLAAKCISLYLETDHPLLGHFDPDLFLANLVSDEDGERQYCSSLLVNSLLFWACQMYSDIDPETDGIALSCCAEAEKLWKNERDDGRDSILNMAAAVFLCLGHLGQGGDVSVLKYLGEACDMGTRMQFFGAEDSAAETIEMDQGESNELARAQMHATWGVFNFAALMSLFYRQPGMQILQTFPRLPIPDLSARGASTARVSPVETTGQIFPHLCRFWKIMHEVSVVYSGNGTLPWASRATLVFAEFKFRELLAWCSSLPFRMSSQQDDSLHHVKVMHLWFHAAILDIFRPFTVNPTQRNCCLRTFSSTVTAQNIYVSSSARLNRLILNYRLQYASSSYTILWHTALLYAANAMLELKDTNDDEEGYPYMLLFLFGYVRLSRTWRVAKAISKGLLSLILYRGDMSSALARRMLSELDRAGDGADDNEIQTDISATFMMDLQRAPSEPNSSTVEKLAEDFEANAMMMEYTNIME